MNQNRLDSTKENDQESARQSGLDRNRLDRESEPGSELQCFHRERVKTDEVLTTEIILVKLD